MSGYPYGNPGGGYPPQYGSGNSGYQNYPQDTGFQPTPPIPGYNDTQSCASLYGSAAPAANNMSYPPGPYDSYGGNQMPNQPYGMGGAGNYPPPPSAGGYPPPPAFNQPPQPYGGGYGNPQVQAPYPQQPPPQQYGGGYGNPPPQPPQPPYPNQPLPPQAGGMYPNIPGQQGFGGGMAPPMNPQGGYFPQEQQSIMLASLENYQGTVFPFQGFNAEMDCNTLRNAMKGAGTDERVLIDIVSNRSNVQRQQIKLTYKTMFGVDLVKQVGGETSGHFKEVITALFDAPANYEAWSLHEAMGHGKEGPLREILLTRTNSEIRAIVDAYKRMFNKDLEHEISHRVHGKDFKRMLISAVQANREELNPQQIQQARQAGIESVIDRNRARQDADDLYKAGAGKWGTDEQTFNAIFSRRSYYQLRATFEEYQRKYGKDIAHAIRSEFSGDTQDAYLTLISCIRDRPSYFAERVHKTVARMGTRDSTLIRVIVTRSEIDLVQIKQRYQQLYNRALAQDVGGDTSGDYKRILLSIIK